MGRCNCPQTQHASKTQLDAMLALVPKGQWLNDDAVVLVRDGTWAVVVPEDGSWKKALFVAQLGLGVLWFTFTRTKRQADIAVFHVALGQTLHTTEQMLALGTGGEQKILTVDRSSAQPFTVTDVPSAHTPRVRYKYNWRCLGGCAPTCVTCGEDWKCWLLCAGGCLISCAIQSGAD